LRKKTPIDLCIEWNREKARRAKEPKDRARYEDNIKNLEAFRDDANKLG
jgi:hypothetical protein